MKRFWLSPFKIKLTPTLAKRLDLLFVIALVAALTLVMGPHPASASHLPESAQDILIANPGAPDGEYTIYPNNQVFTVYCHNMATGAPEEYLTLVNTGRNFNFSQYTAGGAVPGTDVVTHYTKIRLDPDTLVVDIGNQTFATSNGGPLQHGLYKVTWMPYGAAEACFWPNVPKGKANIDLRDTPFAVDDEFEIAGWWVSGTVSDSSGLVFSFLGTNQLPYNKIGAVTSQVVNLTGGGYCGYTHIAGAPSPETGDGGLLQLKYIGPTFMHIDIKPGSDRNPINLKSKGVIPVAILSTQVAKGEPQDFDATQIDAGSVKFEGATPAHKNGNGHLQDVDGDGDVDWLGHFRTPSVASGLSDGIGTISGTYNNGQAFIGGDSVNIVGKGKAAPAFSRLTTTWSRIKR